jgi:hypothetical protein
MKHLKSYSEQSELCNESIRQFLKPKSDEEINKELYKKPIYEILLDSLRNNYFEGVRYSLYKMRISKEQVKTLKSYLFNPLADIEIINLLLNHNDIVEKLSKDELYLLEKYKLGLHQDQMKDYEEWFFEKLTSSKVYRAKFNSNILIYLKGSHPIFNYDQNKYQFLCDHYDIYLILKSTFKLDYNQTYLLIKGMAEKYLNIKIDKVLGWNPESLIASIDL